MFMLLGFLVVSSFCLILGCLVLGFCFCSCFFGLGLFLLALGSWVLVFLVKVALNSFLLSFQLSGLRGPFAFWVLLLSGQMPGVAPTKLQPVHGKYFLPSIKDNGG